MSTNMEFLEAAVGGRLIKEVNLTSARIRELISQYRVIESLYVDDEAAELLARRLEERLGITMSVGSTLIGRNENWEPWLPNTRKNIDPYYWSRYFDLLVDKGFSPHVLARTDEVTDRILNLLENPAKVGPWDRRGMVVGHVQSGKTSNYTGLVCKAADAGYKLIVVVAGIHNNLRNQTQGRLEEGFVGWDNLAGKRVGVGKRDSRRRPTTLTNVRQDFAQAVRNSVGLPLQNLSEPALFVVKKNSSTLRNLIDWLRAHNARLGGRTVDYPMILIDDEADNASINVRRGKDEVSRINGQIRDLLKMFERSGYVGYTATPFANIFIDPDTENEMFGSDLFPKDFIISLDPPSNYFGANTVFIDDSDKILRAIHDNEPSLPIKHPITHQVTALPSSLQDAVRAFVIGRAIRLLRGQHRDHCSMLVNASRFTAVQAGLRNEIHTFLSGIQTSLRVNGLKVWERARLDSEIAALYDVWNREYRDAGHDWLEIFTKLYESASPIKVVEINSRSAGALNYADHEDGMSVIAVGGYSLSRGLTLEGLMVSYFLRNSIMYDTLMQMGRWFGYRPGYEDLCRIWMTTEASGWYSHISESIEELRDELRGMEAVGATPSQFGLRVRSHPDTLIVTARNKMGSGQTFNWTIKLANRFIETSILKSSDRVIELNKDAARELLRQIETDFGKGLDQFATGSQGWLIPNVSSNLIIGFLRQFQNHPESSITEPRPVIRYIEDRVSGELALWDVYIPSVKGNGPAFFDNSLGLDIYCQKRTRGKVQSAAKDMLLVGDKRRVSSRGVEKAGLTAQEIADAEAQHDSSDSLTRRNGKPSYPDYIYRRKRTKPLLVLHLLGIVANEEDSSPNQTVVAWSISFPETALEEQGTDYVVNTVYFRDLYQDDLGEDEMDGDNV